MEDEEEKYQTSMWCCLDWPASRHAHHRISERPLLHHDHGGSSQEDGGETSVRGWWWLNRVKDAKDQRRSGGVAGPTPRSKQAFVMASRLKTAGRNGPPIRRNTQFSYDPQSYIFNFETKGGAYVSHFAQRFAPPEKKKKKNEIAMNSQVPLVQPL